MSAERVALNDATFRNANEGIEGKAESLGIDPVPFLCECADGSCTDVIRLSRQVDEEIRSDSTHFVNVPGHDASAGPHARVVEKRAGYVIVQKLGVAADIVSDLDELSRSEERTG